VFWAVLLALFMSGLQNVLFQRNMRIGEFMQYVYKGVGAMIPVVSILIFAFAIGKTMGDLGTGKYLANLVADSLPVAFLPLVVFWLSAIMAFSTGTSFGTFGLMIPIALQMGAPMDANLYALIGAVVSGGIFGDHCSPISDTTIMASMVTASDHIHHVKTQMPYALLGAVISSVMFVLAGFIF
jgi:Na+/H+ antiporter NhaC